MKRMAFKKQKRWWNAYILFYERMRATPPPPPNDVEIHVTADAAPTTPQALSVPSAASVVMPSYILKSVHKKNIKFLHHRHHFSQEYFQFVKKLIQANLTVCHNDLPLVGASLLSRSRPAYVHSSIDHVRLFARFRPRHICS